MNCDLLTFDLQDKKLILKKDKPNIVVIIARGEAVRNFIYSNFLKTLSKDFNITLLTQINHPDAIDTALPYTKNIIKLNTFQENNWVILFREIIHSAHYKMMWTEAVKYYWGRHNNRVKNLIIMITKDKKNIECVHADGSIKSRGKH